MNSQFTYEQAIKAVQATLQLHDKTADFLNAQGLKPKTDSLAEKELQTFERPGSLLTAYSQGTSLIEVAADHLAAFTRTVTEPVQNIAPWTLARAVLESCALSCWLLDTKVTSRQRVGRSLALRYEGLVQQYKFSQALPRPSETAKVKSRIEEVEAVAESIGFSKLRSDKGKRIGIGQVMPTITEIVRDTLNEEAHYRLFSAMAHAHHWAFSQLSFKRAGAINFHDNKALLMEKNLPIETVLWLCSHVSRYFAQPLKLQCELYGWDFAGLKIILDGVFNEMDIRPDSELWHTQQDNAA
jgi:hypothetical protein